VHGKERGRTCPFLRMAVISAVMQMAQNSLRSLDFIFFASLSIAAAFLFFLPSFLENILRGK
jgi:hypothetical protein